MFLEVEPLLQEDLNTRIKMPYCNYISLWNIAYKSGLPSQGRIYRSNEKEEMSSEEPKYTESIFSRVQKNEGWS